MNKYVERNSMHYCRQQIKMTAEIVSPALRFQIGRVTVP